VYGFCCHAYSLIGLPHDYVSVDLLRRKDVPLKVSAFAWWLLQNRLPSEVNLFRRGVVLQESQLCVSGCGLQESENRLFFACSILVRFGNLLDIG